MCREKDDECFGKKMEGDLKTRTGRTAATKDGTTESPVQCISTNCGY